LTHKIITERLIKYIEENKAIPWQKPWSTRSIFPTNFFSKRAYHGINLLMLGMMPYECPYWATFKQIKENNGMIKAGEHGTTIVFSKIKTYENKQDDGSVKVRKIPLLYYYKVWNIAQTDLTFEIPEQTIRTIDEADALLKDYSIRADCKINIIPSDRACYSLSSDTITAPSAFQYKNVSEYYGSIFHEVVHSTGHSKRLNRFTEIDSALFEIESYSKEELIAEIGSSFILNYFGIMEDSFNNSAAYLDGWLKKLRSDVKLIVSAASAASKAYDYILGTETKNEENTKEKEND